MNDTQCSHPLQDMLMSPFLAARRIPHSCVQDISMHWSASSNCQILGSHESAIMKHLTKIREPSRSSHIRWPESTLCSSQVKRDHKHQESKCKNEYRALTYIALTYIDMMSSALTFLPKSSFLAFTDSARISLP